MSTVMDYINTLSQKPGQKWQTEVCLRLRQMVHETLPTVDERMQYGKPHYRQDGKYAAVISTAKGWVTFTIFNATGIEGPEGFFEDDNSERKTLKIYEGDDINYALLATLLNQAASSILQEQSSAKG